MFRIDSIKSAARRAAWKAEPGNKYDGFNVFSRSTSNTSVTREKSRDNPKYDEEAAIGARPFEQQSQNHINREDDGTKSSDSPTSTTDVESQFGAAADYYRGDNVSRATTLSVEADSVNPAGAKKRLPGVSEEGDANANGVSPTVADEKGDRRDSDDSSRAEERKRKQDEAFKRKIPFIQQFRTVLAPRWLTINWLLIFAPVGIGLHFTKVDPLVIFIVNFIAIIPLAGILSFATEEIAIRVGEVLGGLLNASFGNAVELIVGIIALAKKEIIIVQTSLIGSMLSNLLLVMGMCFFFGGVNRLEQHFNMTVAQTAASILALAVGAILIPTAFTWGQGAANPAGNLDEELSRGTAIILLLVYGAYLFFQLKSHKEMYNAPSQKTEKRKKSKKDEGEVKSALAAMGGASAAASGGQNQQQSAYQTPEEEPEVPSLSMIGALVTLAIATAFIGVCAEFLVDSINEVTCKYHVSQYFVGLILLPIVGNAAEHATAVTVAIKDKMDLAIGVAVGSSMQIALLVLPLMVILGWIIKSDMTLVFDDFQIVVLFVAIVLVNYLIGDGKSRTCIRYR